MKLSYSTLSINSAITLAKMCPTIIDVIKPTKTEEETSNALGWFKCIGYTSEVEVTFRDPLEGISMLQTAFVSISLFLVLGQLDHTSNLAGSTVGLTPLGTALGEDAGRRSLLETRAHDSLTHSYVLILLSLGCDPHHRKAYFKQKKLLAYSIKYEWVPTASISCLGSAS